jgi:hypothetical protein
MHPDLYLRIYQQQERELEQRLLHRLAERDRPQANPSREGLGLRVAHILHRKGTAHF